MPRPMTPHPVFSAGSMVRVRTMPAGVRPVKLRLAGRVGTVVQSSRTSILVEFPGEKFREHFPPHHLDQVANQTN